MTKTEERQFAAGQTIFREGDEAGGEAFVIQSGTVAIRKLIHGQARTIRTIGRGRMFGEIALFSKAPRSADAVAEEDTRVFVIPADRLDHLVKTYPDFALDLIRDLATCVLDAEERLGARHVRRVGDSE
jgi:CRP-like cAMP-binding protein